MTGAEKKTYTLDELAQITRDDIAAQLTNDIAAYDGSPKTANEIVRGFVAARQMNMDLRPFEDLLAARAKALDDAAA